MHTVVLYMRAGCHLCELARAALDEVHETDPFELDEVDIETTDDLVRDYGYRVPVVAVDGEEVFEIEVDRDALRTMLRPPG